MESKYFIIYAGISQWELARDIGDGLSEQNHRWCISFVTIDFELKVKRVTQEEFNEFNNLKRNKMTAVEWLVKELNLEGYDYTVEQAKKIEKEQIMNAHYEGSENYRRQYYNETFKPE